MAKCAGSGFDKNSTNYIYFYLKNRWQTVRINNVWSEFKGFVSRLPQESIVGTILFSVFLKDFFNTNEKASAHNFADSNTLSVFAKTTHELVH